MARQTYYLAKDVRHPLYKTRMLQAGPLELDASAARLYQRLGVELSEEAPKRAAPKAEPTTVHPNETIVGESPLATAKRAIEAVAPKPAAKKAPAKKATRRKKS